MNTQKLIISNREILISKKDFEYINLKTWHVVKTGKSIPIYYVRNSSRKNGKHKNTMLHRYILEKVLNRELTRKELVDHINGNPFDNRRENLRIVDRFQSAQNTGKQKDNTSGYKGVSKHSDGIRWIAVVQTSKKTIRIGSYTDVMIAAEAYDRAALHFWGEYARLNFPENKDKYKNEKFGRNLMYRSKKKKTKGTSSFMGVYKGKSGKWISQITINKKIKTLGSFELETDAAKAYDRELVKHYGPGSEINFPVIEDGYSTNEVVNKCKEDFADIEVRNKRAKNWR